MVWGICLSPFDPSFRGALRANPESRDSGSAAPRLSGMTATYVRRRRSCHLPHQLLHRIFQTFDRDREHAARKDAADDGGRFRIVPMLLRYRIEPHRMRIGADDAIEPDRTRLL